MLAIIEKEMEKTFNNTMNAEETHFTEADFRFKEEESKVQPEAKGNYNFLQNYIQAKPEPAVNPTQNPTGTVNPTYNPPPVPNVNANIPPPTNVSPPQSANNIPPTNYTAQYVPPIPQQTPVIPPIK